MLAISGKDLCFICFAQKAGVAPGIFRRGLTLPTRGLKYGFQGTLNAKNLQKNRFSSSEGGLACSDGGYSPLAPLAPPLTKSTPQDGLKGAILRTRGHLLTEFLC